MTFPKVPKQSAKTKINQQVQGALMAALANTRREKYAQGLARGLSQTDAGSLAGYSVNSSGNMSRLAAKPEIRARVAELTGHEYTPQKSWTCDEVTRQQLIERAQAAYNIAHQQEKPSDMLKILSFIGEMAGYGKPLATPVDKPKNRDPLEDLEEKIRFEHALAVLNTMSDDDKIGDNEATND